MAHRLASSDRPQSDNHSTENSTDTSGKWRINRRKCLKAGGAALAALVFGGAASSATAENTQETSVHWTNFSEGQL
jgi:hypothetical protein